MKQLAATIFLCVISLGAFCQLPEFEWAIQCGNPPNTTDTKTTLANGKDGRFFLSGEFLDTVMFSNKMIVSAGGTDIFLVKYASRDVVEWSNRIGASDYDFVQKIVTDDEENVIISGSFYGTTQIGPDQYTAYGSQDLFIAKFNQAGDFLWSYRAGGTMADYITGIALDADQSIIVTGYFYDGITFGDTTISSSGSSDIFLARFDANGGLQWISSAGGSSSDQVRSTGIDSEGNILISGSFYNDITLGDTSLTTSNPVGVVIAKYFPDGRLEQAFQLDGTYLTPEVYLTTGQNGDFYISGNFSEQLVFGSEIFNAGEFNQDIFIAKYNASCDLQWAKHAFSPASDQVIGIETDTYNNLYLTGHYLDTIRFGPLTLPYTLCCGSREIFVVNYSATGDLLWGEQISGTRASIQSLEMNDQGELLMSGLFTEEVLFGDLKLSHFDGFLNYVTSLQTDIYNKVGRNLITKELRIYPNPALANIRVLDLPAGLFLDYVIYSIEGNLIASGTTRTDDLIDISSLASGAYFLQLVDKGKNAAFGCLFIKQ